MQKRSNKEKRYLYYNGIEGLRASGNDIQLTDYQKAEIEKCKYDPVYFLSNYIQIVSLDAGLTKFEPFDYQIEAIDNILDNRFLILNWGRQLGKCVHYDTTITLAKIPTIKTPIKYFLYKFFLKFKFFNKTLAISQ